MEKMTMNMAMDVKNFGDVVGMGIRIDGGIYQILNLQVVSDGIIISAKSVKETIQD